MNLSRSGPSLSLGVRGAHVTVGSRGVTKTVGLPGTGVFYTSRSGHHSGYHSAASATPLTPEEHARAAQRVETLGALIVVLLIGVLVVLGLGR